MEAFLGEGKRALEARPRIRIAVTKKEWKNINTTGTLRAERIRRTAVNRAGKDPRVLGFYPFLARGGSIFEKLPIFWGGAVPYFQKDPPRPGYYPEDPWVLYISNGYYPRLTISLTYYIELLL